MKLCVWFIALMCISHWCSAKDVDVFNTKDTTWIVNYWYSQIERDTFDFKLNIPKLEGDFADYRYIYISWGIEKDGSPEYSERIDVTSLPGEWGYKYPSGKYFVKIKYYQNVPSGLTQPADREVCFWIFNQDLQGHIAIEGKEGCIERRADTFRVWMVDHLENPPGTKYTVEVKTDVPGDDDIWRISPDPVLVKDSALIIFTAGTGSFGADIRFRMTYREGKNPFEVRTSTTEKRTVHVYQAPNLKEIFNFRDTLTEGENIEDFKRIEVCTNEELTEIRYDSLINEKYVYVDGLPMYRSRYNFTVDYFRKDSVNQKQWINVTADSALVDTTNMLFKYPGFYKIRMVAYNECGLDSLHTDSIRYFNEKRHIVVFQGGTNVIRCNEDTLCGVPEGGRVISFMDTGKRFDWDPIPEYNFIVIRNKDGEPDKDTVDLQALPEIAYYRNDAVFDPGESQAFECDSTLLKIKLYEPGQYTIHLKRSRHCDPPVTYTHVVTIGDIPALPLDTLWKYFGQETGIAVEKCDTFQLKLPEIRIDSNFLKLDSVQWCFRKGEVCRDTLYQTYGVEQFYKFDSIGDIGNFIVLKAHNFCGWSKPEHVKLFTRKIPHAKLLRDSMEKNDTLCVGVDYAYHWEGDLPEEYNIRASWSKRVFANDVRLEPDEKTYLSLVRKNEPSIPGKVRFENEANKIYQYYIIENFGNKNCRQEIKDSVVIVGVPEEPVYDTVRYCADLGLLNTEVFFKNHPPQLKNVEWKWNQEPGQVYEQDNYNPAFLLSNPVKVDTLYVKVSNSKGCYKKRNIILEPQVVPNLVLAEKSQEVCADTVISSSTFTADYITMTNAGTGIGVNLKVYKNKIEPSGLLFDTVDVAETRHDLMLNHQDADTVRLIYALVNSRVTEGFGNCVHKDTIELKVWKPLIRITGTDTIQDITAMAYHFVGSSVRIDTADIENKFITWTILNGNGTFNGSTESHDLYPFYTLADSDKTLDSLAFELSGHTPCGDHLRDTLIVYLPKEKIWIHADTICNDNTGYVLWAPERTFGKFVHIPSLQWELLADKNGLNVGKIEPSTGSGAKYIPSFDAWQADTVKIKVLAWNLYDPGHNREPIIDTIYLKVNHMPENIYPDTLYLKANTAEGRRIIFDQIKVGRDGTLLDPAKAYCQNIKWEWIMGEGIGGSFYPSGTKSGIDIGAPLDANLNYATNLKIHMVANAGCYDKYDKVILIGVLPPAVSLSDFDLCDQGSVQIDTGIRVKGVDKFTALKWSHNGNGTFSSDFTYYQAGQNDPITEFTLDVSKHFTLYSGEPADYYTKKQGKVRLFREPDFSLFDGAGRRYTHDTLCMDVSHFMYKQDWIHGNFSGENRKEYLVADKSVGLTGDFPDFELQEGITEAKLIVSANLGTCKMWEDKADTLYITRLKKMIGDFGVPDDICEGATFQISNVQIDPMAETYSWTATGGILNLTNPLQPIFTSTASGTASVSLTVTPPRGCSPVTGVTHTFDMFERPSLILRDTTVCEGMGLTFGFDRHPKVQFITWKANGRIFATTTTESVVTYDFHLSDVTDNKVEIIGEITPESPCTGVIFSNIMTVTFQKKPEISGSLQGKVCQGDTLSLDMTIVAVANQNSVLWNIEEGEGQIENAGQINARYIPGEISGGQILKITAQGLHGCVDTSELVKVTVDESILPVIGVPNIKCEGTEITFTHEVSTTRPQGATGTWYVNDVKESETWYSFKKNFDTAGEYTLRFTTTYNDKCSRSAVQKVRINPVPVVDFSCQSDSIIGVGKEVQFVNQTAGTVSYQWDFHEQGTEISDENGTHIHRFDLSDVTHVFTDVTLTVTDGNYCQASKTKTLKVVNIPQAAFKIAFFDPCTGHIEFENLSQGENMTYEWELGNGTTVYDTIPADISYTPGYRDSIYTITLKVSNAGGDSEFLETVRTVSLLKPKFIISPDKEDCEKRRPVKGVANRSEGDADLYIFSWGDHSPDGIYTEFVASPVYHKYSNPEATMKKFYVTLTAANACHSETYLDSILIHPNAVNAMILPEVTRVCFGNEITFRNESFGFGEDAQAWWSFGDKQDPIVNNHYEVPYRFSTPGTYPVRLIMTDRCNSDTSDIVNIYVLGDLSLDFVLEDGPYCSGQKIEMKVLPELKGKFTNFHWDFGDGYPENGTDSVMQKYLYPDTYSVKLTANSVSEGNCPVTTRAKEVQVRKTPFASISPVSKLSDCAPYTVTKLARVGTGNEQVFWDFRNGETSTNPEVHDILYTAPGEYPVLLKLISEDGCVDTTTKTIIVKATPRTDFTIADSMFCTKDGNIDIILDNQTADANELSFEWSYNGLLPFSRSEQPGTLSLTNMFDDVEVKLVATHRITGCADTLRHKVISGHVVKLEVDFDTNYCYKEAIELVNKATDITAMKWDLGDGTYMSEHAFTYVYDEPGQYEVRVMGSNGSGCKDSLTKKITIYPLPTVDFSYEEDHMALEELQLPEGIDFSQLPDVKNGIFRFINRSIVDQYQFTSGQLNAFWNFGDGSGIIAGDEVNHHFPNNGHYEVKLLVKADHGCADSVSQFVSIDAVKGLFIPNAFAPGAGKEENPGVALFQPKGIGLFSYKIQVYDYWGTCVWSSDKLVDGRPAEAWDGTFNGQPLPKGRYTWKVNAIFIDGTVWEGEKGHTNGILMLIR